jgi:SAM-dependent methyltransferase
MKSYIKEFSERPPYFAEHLFFERHHGGSAGPILEIGCSVGHLMRYGAERKIGIDYDLAALAQARAKQFSVALMDVQRGLSFKDNSFTSIECQHVIEHVKNPLFLLQECFRVLKPGGKLVIVTPNIKKIRFDFYEDYSHISPFIKKSLLRIAYDAGFSAYEVQAIHVGYPLGKFLYRRGWLTLSSALKIQSLLFAFGMKAAQTLVLVAKK